MPRAPGLDPLMDDLFLTHQKPLSFLWLKSHYSGQREKEGQQVLNRPRETGHFFPLTGLHGLLFFSLGRGEHLYYLLECTLAFLLERPYQKSLANVKALKEAQSVFPSYPWPRDDLSSLLRVCFWGMLQG